jgi:hypothetical protein
MKLLIIFLMNIIFILSCEKNRVSNNITEIKSPSSDEIYPSNPDDENIQIPSECEL